MPEVPTIAEAGVPGYDVTIWYAVMGPAKLPEAIVRRLSADLEKVVASPKVREGLEGLGNDAMYMPSEEANTFIHAENRKWAEVVRVSGARAE
jgi:tripartite-type tricarboxylate transporter receptor subunit TctC